MRELVIKLINNYYYRRENLNNKQVSIWIVVGFERASESSLRKIMYLYAIVSNETCALSRFLFLFLSQQSSGKASE